LRRSANFVVREILNRGAAEQVAAAGGPIQATDDVHRPCFYLIPKPHHSQVVTGFHGQAEIVRGREPRYRRIVDLADVAELGHRLQWRSVVDRSRAVVVIPGQQQWAEPSAIAFCSIGVPGAAPLAQLKRGLESTPPTAVINTQATRAARSGCIPARFQVIAG